MEYSDSDDSSLTMAILNDTDSLADTNSTLCEFQGLPFLEFKFILVGIIGTIIALISAVENLILFITFVRSVVLRKRRMIYLTYLSVFDLCVAISYIGIMSTQTYAEYFKNYTLFVFWHEWLRTAFTLSNITFSSASFLLIIATFERYLQTKVGPRWDMIWRKMDQNKHLLVLVSIIFGILFRGTVYFEIDIWHDRECETFSGWRVQLSELCHNRAYNVVWRFWIRRISTIFAPFFILAFCNLSIVYNLHKQYQQDNVIKELVQNCTHGNNFDLGTHRLRVRSTTRTLIIVVTCYLWANILDVIVASWEYIDDDSLKSSPMFYTVATDVSSLLPVLACALRLPIYSANDAIIKNEIRVTCLRVLSCFLICSKKQKNVAAKKEFSIEMNHKVTDDVRIPNPDSQSFTSVLHQSQEEIDIYKLIKTRKNIAKQQSKKNNSMNHLAMARGTKNPEYIKFNQIQRCNTVDLSFHEHKDNEPLYGVSINKKANRSLSHNLAKCTLPEEVDNEFADPITYL